jgi:hypothetical protein
MPIAAASRPACSCWVPSVADTVWAVAAVNVTGSAPYRIWLASSFAVAAVNWPVICDWPVSTPWISGAEMISLSSTTATRQWVAPELTACAAVRQVSVAAGWNASRVSAVHFFWPSLVKSSETTHWPDCWSSCGFALAMSVPSTFAWSSSIFAPLWQLTTWAFGSSIAPGGRLSSCSQLIIGTLNCICAGSTLTSSEDSAANGM